MVEKIAEKIVTAIAEEESTTPEKLDIALQKYVSTDAIRSLMKHNSNAWRLQFETRKHVVELTGNGALLVDGECKRNSL
jgi:hypothetical protein